MYAVLESGGKQYRVCAGQRVSLERLPAQIGEALRFERIVMLEDKERVIIEPKALQGVHIIGKAVAQRRGEKLVVFKKRRRKNSRRKNGHRQYLTDVEIVSIEGVTHEAVTHEAVAHEAAAHEAVTHEAVAHEAVAHEAVAHEAVAHEAKDPHGS